MTTITSKARSITRKLNQITPGSLAYFTQAGEFIAAHPANVELADGRPAERFYTFGTAEHATYRAVQDIIDAHDAAPADLAQVSRDAFVAQRLNELDAETF